MNAYRNQAAAHHRLASLGIGIKMFDHLPIGFLWRWWLCLWLPLSPRWWSRPRWVSRYMQFHGGLSAASAARLLQGGGSAKELSVLGRTANRTTFLQVHTYKKLATKSFGSDFFGYLPPCWLSIQLCHRHVACHAVTDVSTIPVSGSPMIATERCAWRLRCCCHCHYQCHCPGHSLLYSMWQPQL